MATVTYCCYFKHFIPFLFIKDGNYELKDSSCPQPVTALKITKLEVIKRFLFIEIELKYFLNQLKNVKAGASVKESERNWNQKRSEGNLRFEVKSKKGPKVI